MKYKENLKETAQRFDAWFNHEPLDRPMMRVVGNLDSPTEPLEQVEPAANYMEQHSNPEYNVKMFRNNCKQKEYLAESVPNMPLNLGAGSMAIYLGCEPNFQKDTIWFKELNKELKDFGDLKFDKENKWWKFHLEIMKKAVELAKGEFFVSIPDIVENIDILSAMRGPQNICYDMMDYPELLKKYIEQIDDLYFKYYDPMYNLLKTDDNISSYTAFQIIGHGKIAKVQCDHSALISPSDYRKYIVPSLTKQCKQLDGTLYHLDGPDCIRHIDALMEIKELSALQFTPGAGQPDTADEKWYPVYDKVHEAGKGKWISIYDGGFNDWVDKTRALIKRYGKEQLYLLYPDMPIKCAKELMKLGETEWSK